MFYVCLGGLGVYLISICIFCMQKQIDSGKKLITVLDSKRSNAINIGLTKLPPARTIKAAIMKMDSTIINREGVEVSCSLV